MYLYEVYVTNSSLNVNRSFTYYSDIYIDNFKRVLVLFNRKKVQGLIVSSKKFDSLNEVEKSLGFKINKILSVVDKEPLITNKQFELAKWLSYNTVSSFISCLNIMFPKALKISSKSVSVVKEKYIKLKEVDLNSLTVKQKEIYKSLKDNMLLSEARKLSVSIINKFIEKDIIEIIEEEKKYKDKDLYINDNFKTLTNDQKSVFDGFLKTDKVVSLLFGVTGSGKTEVYLHLAKEYLKNNKNVLILVPEISLTPQMIESVKQRFNDVIFYHSELNDQERYEQYKRVKENNVKIVVGTRSSIFLPFNDLGLIIVDEEHDQSYKQDNTPCYNAKDVAFYLAKQNNAKVLLASATPSLDTYSRALKGTFALFTLKERINKSFPKINLVNLKHDLIKNSSSIISKSLLDELKLCVENNKQAIILLNRRGYQPIIRCKDCGSVLLCKNCDIPLSYHNDKKIFKCHQCGEEYKIIHTCPKCGGNHLSYSGFGTMKVEEEINKLLLKARIIRMDADSTSKKNSHQKILSEFGKHNYDILLGTQMISKGLDFPDVTLVGILNADAGLMHQDYNSAKTTLDLLMQASGRSGRADSEGKVIIQTYNEDHYVLKTVINQDYTYFFNIEMNYREKTGYPPYTHLFEIIVSNFNEKKCNDLADYIYKQIDKSDIKIFKPYELRKLSNNYRNRIIIMHSSKKKLLEITWNVIEKALKNNNNSRITVDIDPLYIE